MPFPFEVSPSGGDLAVFGAEERHNAYAVICGYSPSLAACERQEGAALITVSRVTHYIVGYPNEEAYWRDPRGDIGHGICEIIGSGWRSPSIATTEQLRHRLCVGVDRREALLHRLDGRFGAVPRRSDRSGGLHGRHHARGLHGRAPGSTPPARLVPGAVTRPCSWRHACDRGRRGKPALLLYRPSTETRRLVM